jgi:ABC-type multidrug transport system fused ATPase/permease subunit
VDLQIRTGLPTFLDIVIGILLLATVLEANRVGSGWSLPIFGLVFLAYAFFVSWQNTAVCIIVIPAFAYAAGSLGRKIKKSSQRSQERSADLTSLTEETLVARRVVQAFGAQVYESKCFNRARGGGFL